MFPDSLARHFAAPIPRCTTRLAALGWIALVVVAGCGSATGDRLDVTGRVTFDGAPVPVGRIDFIPTEPAAEQSLAGYATIEQGVFNTSAAGRGPTPGQHRVRITGFDDRPPTLDEVDHGPPLFDTYETTIALEPGDVELEFHIPSSSDG